MAKNSVTEQDLLTGVGGIGSFGSLGAGKPVRDSPYRATQQGGTAIPLQQQANADVKLETVASPTPNSSIVAPVASPVQPVRTKVEMLPKSHVDIEPKTPPTANRPKKEKKADLYTEKMSTFLTSEMRNDLTLTARQLNSRRLVKGDPITAHSLLRCGVRLLTDLLEFSETDIISSEEELYAIIKKKIKALG